MLVMEVRVIKRVYLGHCLKKWGRKYGTDKDVSKNHNIVSVLFFQNLFFYFKLSSELPLFFLIKYENIVI